jgi:nucleotide-binding universal stress UspA family protein
MTYRTILAYAHAAPEAAPGLEIAAALAARCGATLDGVFVKAPFIPPPMDGMGYVPPSTWESLLESYEAYVAEAEATARTTFQSAVSEAGAQAEWSTVEDGTAHGFIGLARCSDLVVFPKAGMSSPYLPPMDLAHDAAAPVVLVPKSPRSTQPGRKVLVAWNGSREAASALRGAWPILEAADQVDVVMVEPPPEAEAFIDRRLARHGVKARFHVVRNPDAGAGEIIRDHAEDLGVDLVVMGLYGHSRLRELVLGGASRVMLGQETFPLLVSR